MVPHPSSELKWVHFFPDPDMLMVCWASADDTEPHGPQLPMKCLVSMRSWHRTPCPDYSDGTAPMAQSVPMVCSASADGTAPMVQSVPMVPMVPQPWLDGTAPII